MERKGLVAELHALHVQRAELQQQARAPPRVTKRDHLAVAAPPPRRGRVTARRPCTRSGARRAARRAALRPDPARHAAASGAAPYLRMPPPTWVCTRGSPAALPLLPLMWLLLLRLRLRLPQLVLLQPQGRWSVCAAHTREQDARYRWCPHPEVQSRTAHQQARGTRLGAARLGNAAGGTRLRERGSGQRGWENAPIK